MDELTIGDKTYISSKRAAEITGYAKDYVGQLCREGRVEATLVGRSWYVLESSIRAHRFGDSEPKVREVEEPSRTFADTWKEPKYEAESYTPIATIGSRHSINLLDNDVDPTPSPAAKAPETIEDMQSAWKEWFANREKPLLETPQIIDAREADLHAAAEAVETPREEQFSPPTEPAMRAQVPDPVPFTPVIEDIVPIRRSHETHEVVQERPQAPARPLKRHRKRRNTSYLAVRTALLSVALLAATVAAVGAGLADTLIEEQGPGYSVVRFLGGAKLLEK